ncbi:hypothetical protein [Armatimonas rosea]|uniref:Uncharacterized protein n=1 Tax=Armatimonas rosea TaxID=685828 RepID=A0A7W9W5U1_ARMRO|nr:hypothetical protein [Armatimonas rosea]MBB6049275.1 hypothetical protein [Armatimonas rosea]
MTGTRIISSWTDEKDVKIDLIEGTQKVECRFYQLPIRPGRQVMFELWMFDGALLDQIENARILDVVEGNISGFSNRADQGVVICNYDWRFEKA